MACRLVRRHRGAGAAYSLRCEVRPRVITHAARGFRRFSFGLRVFVWPRDFLLFPLPQRRAPRAWPAREAPLCRAHGGAAPTITYHQLGLWLHIACETPPCSACLRTFSPPACAVLRHACSCADACCPHREPAHRWRLRRLCSRASSSPSGRAFASVGSTRSPRRAVRPTFAARVALPSVHVLHGSTTRPELLAFVTPEWRMTPEWRVCMLLRLTRAAYVALQGRCAP